MVFYIERLKAWNPFMEANSPLHSFIASLFIHSYHPTKFIHSFHPFPITDLILHTLSVTPSSSLHFHSCHHYPFIHLIASHSPLMSLILRHAFFPSFLIHSFISSPSPLTPFSPLFFPLIFFYKLPEPDRALFFLHDVFFNFRIHSILPLHSGRTILLLPPSLESRVFTKFRILAISYISNVFFYFVPYSKVATISRK
jgi:hypothetical protein